jgi:hypothetical protein
MNGRSASIALSAAAAFVLAVGAAPIAAAPCPGSVVQMDWNDGPFTTGLATFDSTDVDTRVTFNRERNEVGLESASGGRAYDQVRVVEALDVAGLAPGTIVNATLTFALDGSVYQSCGASGCGVELSATLRSGPDSVSTSATIVGAALPTPKPLVETLALPVTFTVGAPVTVEFALDYGTGPGQENANGVVTGRWSVVGLPAGAWAVSCLGTTPARPRTWGALKLRYR